MSFSDNKGTVMETVDLSPDRQYASLLLAWGRSLDVERITFEQWQDRREEGAISGDAA